MPITSAQNSKIKLVNRLRTKRGREAEARFVIDYERDLRRALRLGYQIDYLLYCPELTSLADYSDYEAHELSPRLLARASYRQNPDGIIAVMHSREAKGLEALYATPIEKALILVNLRVPGNIGALMRSADASALDAVILVDSALDLYNPNIIRSSTGACFRENIFQTKCDDVIVWLRKGGFQSVTADVEGNCSIYDIDFRGKSAIVLGAEDQGLDSGWINVADLRARIPMAGRVTDSLNVSVSGAIFMYELYRQRQLG